jgi:hypothetical protein
MMKKLKMMWIPVLLGTLLMATLAGVAGARPNARPEASPALVNYMFSAFNCIPEGTPTVGYGANFIACMSGTCAFVCPIKPPHEGLIRVQRLAMYAYDNDGTPAGIYVTLFHEYPKTGGAMMRLGPVCTTDSTADPEVHAYNPANFKVSVLQDIHLIVSIPTSGQKLHGFKLKYEPL